MSACVLHNFCILHDDFDDSYFFDDHDGDDEGIDDGHAGGGPDGPLAAEAKPVQLMNMTCWRLFDKAQTTVMRCVTNISSWI